MIQLQQSNNAPNFCFEVVDLETGQSDFIRSDWEYPATASRFGYVPCKCGNTDGTVDCEHFTATEMISRAYEFLTWNIGKTVPADY